MTRRTLLVPLFAAAFILAPSELDGQVPASAAPEGACAQEEPAACRDGHTVGEPWGKNVRPRGSSNIP